jgi:hypothetical protein
VKELNEVKIGDSGRTPCPRDGRLRRETVE